MARRDKTPYWGRKIVITLILAFAFLTVAIYIGGLLYFRERFLPGTSLNGYDVSFRTKEEAEALLTAESEAFVLEVDTMNGGVESISAEEAGYRYVPDGSVGELLKEQDLMKWYLSLLQTRKLTTAKETAVDDELLLEAVNGLRCMDPANVTSPVNAGLIETEDGFVITPETVGNELDKEKVLKLIREAFLSVTPRVDLVESGCYLKPRLYKDSPVLLENQELMNRIRNVVITYDFAYDSETVDRSLFEDWILVDAEGRYDFDRQRVRSFVSELSSKYDTVGKERSFRKYDGGTITLANGNYGWKIGTEEETEALISDIKEGVSKVKEPIYAQRAISRDTYDIGDTYIEVDLTDQRLMYYRKGKLELDTPVVTATWYDKEVHTPTGCFAIESMQSPALLYDHGWPVRATYFIQFDEAYSLHDNPKRLYYGGDIYMLDGTDGSVEIPGDAMKSLYGQVTTDTAIIIYEE